jgi:molybdopterin molybdotransferase
LTDRRGGTAAVPGDCFAYGGERIGVRAALDLLRERVATVVGTETVPLARSAGRILAETVVSPRDVPAFDNAAVDGYAFAGDGSTAGGSAPRGGGQPAVRLDLWPGRSAAGHPFRATIPPRHALKVLTGAPMPPGTDTVALQEEVAIEGDRILVPAGLRPGANRRRSGEDVRRGQPVLEPGRRLAPQHIGVAAELGFAELRVRQPLDVAVFSTGDELVPPGRALPEGGVYDANRFILTALLAGLPARVRDLGILPDDPAAVRTALQAAASSHHVVLTSGGASRGEEDHVVRGVAALGRLDFWQIAMKPGRPLAFGSLGQAVFVGLPGNPVAAMVCFLLFARPVLLRLAGADWPEPRRFPVPASFSFRKKPGRSEYLRARLGHRPDGTLATSRVERDGSGILTSMTEADGLVELDEAAGDVRDGDLVPYLSFAEFGL